ncbi:hypothetical protein HU200_061689 [Digitaria exilis]|uniref:Uncharacterized protein n=1 Tax=Digitaria exilis TaxID=1010633 RepID=A0A835A894_9POAL|nr:hypothetical protein HU200_061689 [Digitaria exilis]
MAPRMTVLLTLAFVAVLLTAGELAAAVSGQERLLLDLTSVEHRTVSAMPVHVARDDSTGAVEEDKAYIVGRPLFKVPPSSPCRAKAMRC